MLVCCSDSYCGVATTNSRIITDTFCPNTPITKGTQIQLALSEINETKDYSDVFATINGHEYVYTLQLPMLSAQQGAHIVREAHQLRCVY